jgi:hypothetical protein
VIRGRNAIRQFMFVEDIVEASIPKAIKVNVTIFEKF